MSLEFQRYGRNKNTLVNKTYINSGEYRNKFDKITDNKDVNRVLYQKAKEMLLHRSGTLFEDMYWIDATSGKIVASALNEKEKSGVKYTKAINKAISGKTNLITMHTHPQSMPPSIADFNSNFERKYAISIIVCHDGKIFQYESNQYIEKELYLRYINSYLISGFSDETAQLKALGELMKNYNIKFWEVD